MKNKASGALKRNASESAWSALRSASENGTASENAWIASRSSSACGALERKAIESVTKTTRTSESDVDARNA